MSSQVRQRIRLAIDVSNRGSLVDQMALAIPNFVRNTDAQIELGFFNKGVPLDITPWSTVTASVIPVGANTPLYMQSVSRQTTVLPDGGGLVWRDTMSSSGWNAGTEQHVIIVTSAAQTNVVMATVDEIYQMVISSQSVINSPMLPVSPSYSGGSYAITLPVGNYYSIGGAHEHATAAIQIGSAAATSLSAPTGFSLAAETVITLHSTPASSGGTVTAYIQSSGYSPTFVAGVGVVEFNDYGVGYPAMPLTLNPNANVTVVDGQLSIYDTGTNSWRAIGCANGSLFVV